MDDELVSRLFTDLPFYVGADQGEQLSSATLSTVLSLLRGYGYRLVPSSVTVTDYTDVIQAIEAVVDIALDPNDVLTILHYLTNRGWTILPPNVTS